MAATKNAEAVARRDLQGSIAKANAYGLLIDVPPIACLPRLFVELWGYQYQDIRGGMRAVEAEENSQVRISHGVPN